MRDSHADNEQRTAEQVVAFVVALVVCGAFCIGFAVYCWGNDGPAGDIAIADRINPNTASAGSLMRLSGIGPARAADIIEYRQQFAGASAAFEKASDMENIKGIGEKTVKKIEPWLCFE